MPFFISFNTVSKLRLLFLAFIIVFLIILPCGAKPTNGKKVTKIGAILDLNTRIAKEEKIAMQTAVQGFNNESKHHKLSIYFQDCEGSPLQALYAAEELIKEERVDVIIGMDKWEEAALVAEIGGRAHIPVLSFSAPAVTPPLTASRWPFLVRMASNDSVQMRCIAEMVQSYRWRKVVAVYEDCAYGIDSGKLALLSKALQDVGSEIEHELALPPFSSLSNPQEVVEGELQKLVNQKIRSRVFIILRSSLPMMIHLFREAHHMGFVGKGTVWILTNQVAGYLDSVNSSVIHSMQGALGIKRYYDDSTTSYQNFYAKFRQNSRVYYPEEDYLEPGIRALRAYDSIATIFQASKRVSSNTRSQNVFLENILSSNFTGLSGQVSFQAAELMSASLLRIVNVIGKRSYKELDFWFPKCGFSRSILTDCEHRNLNEATGLKSPVSWPGDLLKIPKGWLMPTNSKRMKIGVPGRASFKRFVSVVPDANKGYMYYGFCIDLFHKVRELLDYDLPYEFEPFNGTYDDLVNLVHNKTYDAVVGDVTILSNRSEKVEFTQPFTASGLSMIVPAKPEESAWMFMKPFTKEMWLVTGALLAYTMLIVWFLEHQTNPEYEGTLKNQISTAIWFTLTSLYFAHRGKIYNNLTRVVLVVWFFVVLILTSSYTANLTSMLTVQKLLPNVTDMELVRKNNLKVGCDGDSFMRSYLEHFIGFKPENIINVSSPDKFEEEFKSGNISAAFLELPYGNLFVSQHCKKFTAVLPSYRFEGLGFAFQKGSPVASDFSKAILQLLERGDLEPLQQKWFAPSEECSGNPTDNRTESLTLKCFSGLFLITGGTSTICFLTFLISLLKSYWQHLEEAKDTQTSSNKSVWEKTQNLARYLYHGKNVNRGVYPTSPQTPDVMDDWSSTRWDVRSASTPGNSQGS